MGESSKAERERRIFKEFARVCRLSIDPDSVESRRPPEPDILCKQACGEKMAFEMVEIVDANIAAVLSEAENLPSRIEEDAERLELPGLRSSPCLVHISFREGITYRSKLSCLDELFSELSEVPLGYGGEWSINRDRLKKQIRNIRIIRGNFPGLHFNVSPYKSFGDPAVDLIEQKCGKRYRSDYPIDLLGYFDRQPCDVDTFWRPRVSAAVDALARDGQFPRIWIYERETNKIWEYPGERSS